MLHLDKLFSFSPSGLTINSVYTTFFLTNLFYINLKNCHRPGPEGVEAKPKKYLQLPYECHYKLQFVYFQPTF